MNLIAHLCIDIENIVSSLLYIFVTIGDNL